MKKTVYICDRCQKKSLDPMTELMGYDFCTSCVKEMVKWAASPSEEKKEEQKQKHVAVKKTSAPPKPGRKAKIDWNKAQALRDAGWTLADIAQEFETSEKYIANYTKAPKTKKAYEHEWSKEEDDKYFITENRGQFTEAELAYG